MKNKEGSSTRSVHCVRKIDPQYGTIVSPIVMNAAFAYENVENWRSVALNNKKGYIYSRNSNPTTDLFEERIAALEGAESATSFATGMAAISTTLFALLNSSDRVVTINDAYGATYLHFTQIFPRFNIECDICKTGDQDSIITSIEKGCKIVYLETPTNPTLKVLDITRLSEAAHKNGAIVIVDNTFATPINQNPIAIGADVVIHSATKYICGHSDVLGGVVCGSKELVDEIYHYRELTGGSLDVYSAHLLLRSLKTLGLRVKKQNENALAIARLLEKHPKVESIFYPGLKNDKGYEIAKKQMSGFGGVLSFNLKGGFKAVSKFLPALKYAYMAANLGQVETVVGPPATTSHVELTDEERAATGIPEGLIRYAVGIEDIDDLIGDVKQALNKL